MASEESRFEVVTRRAFVQRSLAAGAAVLVGGVGLAACGGNDDAEVFSGGDASAAGSSAAADVAASTTTAAAAVAPAGDPLPAAAELQVAFTFTTVSSGGGRPAKNPYIAVWIENAAGEMVQTVSLWLQSGKGQKWWRELTRWYGLESRRATTGGKATADTITGATRTPGDYTVAWNGTDYSGARVGQGRYFLCIEAAREHGPYELIREELTLGAEPFDKALTPKGELTAVSVTYVALA